ncbi:MAG: HAMP domain-containing sensor histidine kinase [Synechococcales cyanobacterium]
MIGDNATAGLTSMDAVASTDSLKAWRGKLLPHSLKTQVTLLVAALSFVPNLALMLTAPWIFGQPLQLTPMLLLWIPTLVLICGWVGYACARQILQPVTRLAQEASTIGVAEEWHTLLRPQDPQETVILRGALAKLLRHIQLEQERREAVIATLMHDLKTPLIAFTHLLTTIRDQDEMTNAQRRVLLDPMIDESHRLEQLVQKMVQVHRYERGTVKLHPQVCDLGSLVAQLVERLRGLAANRQIALTTTGAGTAYVDPDELERAVCNVVENALRYAQSQVTIQVSDQAIEVSDDGPGLPAPLQELAQPYTTIPLAGHRYNGGTGGMGLYIARRILQAHAGDISVVSTAAEGTTLRLSWGGGNDGSS